MHLELDVQKALLECSRAHDLPPPRRRTARALHSLFTWLEPPYAFKTELQVPALNGPFRPEHLYGTLEVVARTALRPSVPLPDIPALRPSLRQ